MTIEEEAQQCQEKKQEGKNEEKIGRGRWRPHPNTGNWCAYGGRRKERKTEGRQKERNREWVPNSAALDYLIASYDPHGSCIYIYIISNPSRQHSKVLYRWEGKIGNRGKVRVKRKWWVVAQPLHSEQGNGKQPPRVKPFKQGETSAPDALI